MNLPNLDESVMNALNFFIDNKPPKLDLSKYNLPFVAGSGNAYNTGTILFSEKAGIFSNESTFRSNIASYAPIIKQGIAKEAIVISASGEKDSVWQVELAKEKGLKTTLMTCSPDSSAAKIADKVIAYRKTEEPYTYNVSTYLGMIISSTDEDPNEIKQLIESIKLPDSFGDYEAYAFILPDKYVNICPMLDIKKSELFGPFVSLRAFSEGHARHAKFVIPTEKELVIRIGVNNEYFGYKNSQFQIDWPNKASFGAMLSLTYYIIGKIQESKPSYFKDNIENYCNDYGMKACGKDKPFDIIVDGN